MPPAWHLGRGTILKDPVVTGIAEAHGRTPAQVLLRWLIQQDGVIAIPKTASPERLEENLAAADIVLSDDDVRELTALVDRTEIAGERYPAALQARVDR